VPTTGGSSNAPTVRQDLDLSIAERSPGVPTSPRVPTAHQSFDGVAAERRFSQRAAEQGSDLPTTRRRSNLPTVGFFPYGRRSNVPTVEQLRARRDESRRRGHNSNSPVPERIDSRQRRRDANISAAERIDSQFQNVLRRYWAFVRHRRQRLDRDLFPEALTELRHALDRLDSLLPNQETELPDLDEDELYAKFLAEIRARNRTHSRFRATRTPFFESYDQMELFQPQPTPARELYNTNFNNRVDLGREIEPEPTPALETNNTNWNNLADLDREIGPSEVEFSELDDRFLEPRPPEPRPVRNINDALEIRMGLLGPIQHLTQGRMANLRPIERNLEYRIAGLQWWLVLDQQQQQAEEWMANQDFLFTGAIVVHTQNMVMDALLSQIGGWVEEDGGRIIELEDDMK
jgi:hypothetical protein